MHKAGKIVFDQSTVAEALSEEMVSLSGPIRDDG